MFANFPNSAALRARAPLKAPAAVPPAIVAILSFGAKAGGSTIMDWEKLLDRVPGIYKAGVHYT